MINQSNISIKINIVNLSTWPTEKILICLDNLSKLLKANKINFEFDYIIDELVTKSITDSLLEKPTLKAIDALLWYLIDFQKLYPQNKLLILGESLDIVNPYGDSLDPLVSLIKELDEKVIWHETVHLLGVTDHYSVDSKMPISACTDKTKCLMQWNAKKGEVFCSKALDEISGYLITTGEDAD